MDFLIKILKLAKWILLPFTLYFVLYALEDATDAYGTNNTEYLIGAIVLVVVNVGLFMYDKKWCDFVDKTVKSLR